MKYALFLGCNIPARLPEYETSTRMLLGTLGVELVDIEDFGCCGYPLRAVDPLAAVLLASRNLALAEARGLDVLVLCQCCYGTLKKAQERLEEDQRAKARVNELLGKEGLSYGGQLRIRHLLEVLWRDIGKEKLGEGVSQPLGGLKISAHYGCHALRPSSLMALDDPSDPKIMEGLLEVVGADPVLGRKRLDCCGAPLLGIEDELSLAVMRKKVEDCLDSGAQLLCVACPYCFLQFQTQQPRALGHQGISVVLITQILGVAMGLSPEGVGLKRMALPGLPV